MAVSGSEMALGHAQGDVPYANWKLEKFRFHGKTPFSSLSMVRFNVAKQLYHIFPLMSRKFVYFYEGAMRRQMFPGQLVQDLFCGWIFLCT